MLSFTSTAQNLEWARQFIGFGTNNDEIAGAIAIDSDGNNYILGTSGSATIDLDPTTDGQELVDNTFYNGSNKISLFLTKLDVDGNFLWGKTFDPGSHFDKAIDIKIGTDGNIYILAMTTGDYNPGEFTHRYITVIKVAPTGTILFTKELMQAEEASSNISFSASSFDLDSQNNIYITGQFQDEFIFDPLFPQFALSAVNGGAFLAKINSSGSIVWTKGLGLYYNSTNFEKVKVGIDGNLNFLLLDGDNPQTSDSGYDLYRINAVDGAVIWSKHFSDQFPTSLGLDNYGNIVIAGSGYSGQSDIDVDPSRSSFFIPPAGYLLFLTNEGNFLEVKKFQTLFNGHQIKEIEFDTNDNVYLMGWFQNFFDADPSENDVFVVQDNSNCNYSGSFFLKLDSNKNFDNAFAFETTGINCSYIYLTDFKVYNDSYNFTGAFRGGMDADPSNNIHELIPTLTNFDGFVIKLNPCPIGPPEGDADQYFCSSENATIQHLLPNSSIIKWYDSMTGGNLLPTSTPLVDGTVYFASRSIEGCLESLRLAVTAHVSVILPDPIVISEVFCASDNATLSSLNVSGQSLKWYNGLTDQTPLNINTLLVDGTTYYVSQTVSTCESNRVPIIASVNTTALPVADSTAFFCIQENKTLADITITGQAIKWYDAQTGGNLLPDTTLLDDGDTYYASQTINGCESERIPVTVTIQSTFGPTGFAVQYFCDTQNLTLADLLVTGTDVVFYDSQFGVNILPMDTPLVDDMGYWASQTVIGCESSLRTPFISDIISDLPANDYTMNVCDNLNDGKEKVDLSDYNENIIPASDGYSFSYYADYNGAENEITTSEITNFSDYELGIGMNTMYVRIENTTLCYKVVMLQLNVIASPILYMADTYGMCEGVSKTITADAGFHTYT